MRRTEAQTMGGLTARLSQRSACTRRSALAVAGAAVGMLGAACGGAAQESSVPRASTQPVTLRLNVRAGGDEALWKFLEPKLKTRLPHVSYAVEGFPGDFTQYLQKV